MNKSSSSGEARVWRVEIIIGEILRRGVQASLILMGVGTLLCFFRDGDYGASGGDAADLERLLHGAGAAGATGLFEGLLAFRGSALILAGLVLLIVTPIVRVAVTMIVSFLEGDRFFGYIALTVLLLLGCSFALGATH